MAPAGPRPGSLAALYAGMVLAWGLNFIFVKVGLADCPPLWLGALRALLGTSGVAVGLLLMPTRVRLDRSERLAAFLYGVPTTGLFFGLWFTGAVQTPPGETAVLVYTFPLWVVVLSPWVLPESPGRLAWASVAVGFAGVVLLEQPWTGPAGRIPIVVVLELVGAAAAWGAGNLFLKARIRGPALRDANFYQLLGGSAFLLPLALLFEPHPVIAVTDSFVVSLMWLAFVGTALANVAWFLLLERFSATIVSTWAFLTPVVALAASIGVFSESLNLLQVLGVAAVLVSVVAVARSQPSRPRGKPSR